MSLPKKRELLPKLHNLIKYLAELSGDVAILELHDQEQASKRVRIKLIEFKNGALKDFQNEIVNVRVDVNTAKGREIKRGKKPTTDLSSES